jgi:hypothetical protein
MKANPRELPGSQRYPYGQRLITIALMEKMAAAVKLLTERKAGLE